jgi:N-acetylglucosaminyldiphosphoundecaprenol N-acetyl-beta-D-mannosaminyltransferase
MSSAVAGIEAAITAGRKGYICVRDVHGLVRCQDDLLLKQIHNKAFLLTPDGMPLVWALKLSGYKQAGRVYGPDLMLALFERGQRNGFRHFLYGTTPEVLQRLQSNLLEKFPSAKIVGSYSPPFRELTSHEEREVADLINASRADIVWVGLSTPKQEFWMARMRERLSASMLIGVGAAFDFHAGVKRQAPRIVQRSGLEWMFRLACEPRRLWRRYAVAVPSFLGLAVAQICNLKDFTIQSEALQNDASSASSDRPSSA